MSEKRFAFGKNWKSYLREGFSPVALERAEQSMKDFLKGETLEHKSFLDVGSGSGIHSLAAKNLGAASIMSIDVDPDSVSSTKSLADQEGGAWKVQHGSMLDRPFMESLGTYDVVYCWGVAHHTGDMRTAFEHLAHRVHKGGLLFIAIYNTVPGIRGSKTWFYIKRAYNSAPRVLQLLMEWVYFLFHVVKISIRLKNPIRVMREYSNKRGMSYKHDLIDWLGGYPYEYARAEEIFDFFHDKHNMELVSLKTTNFIGNNQLLFKKN